MHMHKEYEARLAAKADRPSLLAGLRNIVQSTERYADLPKPSAAGGT